MHRILWVLQIVLAAFFVVMGLMHFLLPDGLPSNFDWMYDLDPWVHYVSGAAEILGGLGLVLPAWTGIQPWLVSLAAGGLALVMVGAAIWHIDRGEANAAMNLALAGLLVFISVSRWSRHPGTERAAA